MPLPHAAAPCRCVLGRVDTPGHESGAGGAISIGAGVVAVLEARENVADEFSALNRLQPVDGRCRSGPIAGVVFHSSVFFFLPNTSDALGCVWAKSHVRLAGSAGSGFLGVTF